MRRRDALRLYGLVGAGGLAGCLGLGSGGRKTVEMTDDLTYDPGSISVPVGGTVVWRNVGSVSHTVTAYEDGIPAGGTYFASGGFDSERAARTRVTAGLIGANEAYEHTFRTAGIYRYFCIPHESAGMVGAVRVKRG